MLSAITALTFLFVIATIIPLSRSSHWLLRAFDFPRLQFIICGFILLINQLIFMKISTILFFVCFSLTIFSIAWQLWWVLPYTRFWHKEVESSKDNDEKNQLTILNFNVLMTNRDAKALVELVKRHNPDVLVTLETDIWWENALSTLTNEMPYTINCPLDNLYGMHVFSKLPLAEQEIKYLVEQDIPSMHTLITLRNGTKVRAHFLHPAPPSPTENERSSERDAELIMVAESIAKTEQPVIVSGDLNDVAWSSTTRLFRKISGLLDPRIGRGMFNTFHTSYIFARWPLDHIFHSKHFTLAKIKRLPSIGSDHFPLLTTLSYNPNKKQKGITAEPEDIKRTKDITQVENVSHHDVPEPGE
ncbi:endonuclease/exonuclease/phosphatase family protein [Colwellia sp. 1_MG-2023]|jgi:endonuclease/exonuclease/phosphatase (EEP) superfamily protein YafD|uniref:endonuclease/exonuclease/phosphatase family protein n=1 Tax=unclassified Colwellia TaxID=196834 RepID=UPI001C09D812|nr:MULTISPECIES: endonuclease/exonuclease/phosphatase family protein [unclassified Colwellia]MBU2926591.1 endonuclease/exonuclease/phosphatase family protein [Colwellia sp. C2M11]MDO6654181.1 endonuclease/exonuclease/phosphatase family protein [Colwellia sp. 3_MG-2023]MDO6667215.1 endonuclease/exonuclease/phosphatase family protein [Colwellia sp. 2_MG-2023]MDO6691576.1 endonuclease/exonuclease/phosphatase family protein [Colwellia sp. 1_MG-2023]